VSARPTRCERCGQEHRTVSKRANKRYECADCGRYLSSVLRQYAAVNRALRSLPILIKDGVDDEVDSWIYGARYQLVEAGDKLSQLVNATRKEG